MENQPKASSTPKTPPPKCSICDETYNKSFRAPITCICDFTCCRSCVKQYISTKVEDIHCMSCRVKWNRDFVVQHFEKNYVATDYRIYRENILFEKEMGLLPMTQPHVEKAIAVEKIEEEIEELKKEQSELTQKIIKKHREISLLKSNSTVERRKYVRKCPQNDCQGFLSQNLKCEICSSWVCSDCREIKGTTQNAEHTCNPEILESVKLLESDTKPCPKCSSMIHKIEGCSQMFCTECHTAFNWNTLRIENGVIHNPHYFEWLRRQNNAGGQIERNPNEILCGRELDNYFCRAVQNALQQLYNKTFKMSHSVFKQNIQTLLQENIKTKYPAEYKKIIKRIDESAEMTKRYNETSQYSYAIGLVKLVEAIIGKRERNFNNSTHCVQIGEMEEFKQCLKKVNQLEVVDCESKIAKIGNIVRHIIHIREVEMQGWNVPDQINNNLHLRIQYMRNRITPEKFKIVIQKRDKETQRNIEIVNILRMFVSCMTDLLYRVLDKLIALNNLNNQSGTLSQDDYNKVIIEIFGKEENSECILKECDELRKYTNTCIEKTLTMYASTMKHSINKNFEYCTK